MKAYSIIILLLLNSLSIISQEKINGIYCVDYQSEGSYKCINFKKDSTFHYETGGCLGIDNYSDGEYSFRNNILTLNHNKTLIKDTIRSFYEEKKWINDTNEITLKFLVKDKNNNVIPYINVFILKEKKGSTTNFEGKSELIIKKSSEDKIITIRYLGYKELNIPIKGYLNYSFEVFLAEKSSNIGIAIKNQIDKLKISEFGKNYFIATDKKDRKIKWVKNK